MHTFSAVTVLYGVFRGGWVKLPGHEADLTRYSKEVRKWLEPYLTPLFVFIMCMGLHFAFEFLRSFIAWFPFRATYPFDLVVLTRNGRSLQVNKKFFGKRNKQCFGTAWVVLWYWLFLWRRTFCEGVILSSSLAKETCTDYGAVWKC